MADLRDWMEPSTLLGGGGLLAMLGAAAKALADWRRDAGQDRRSAEGDIRDDLLAEIAAQRTEITALRAELGQARKEIRELMTAHQQEIRELMTAHQQDIQDCLDRADKFRQELAVLRARVRTVETRSEMSEGEMNS